MLLGRRTPGSGMPAFLMFSNRCASVLERSERFCIWENGAGQRDGGQVERTGLLRHLFGPMNEPPIISLVLRHLD